MHNTREISPGVHFIGDSDRRLELFENLFPLPGGVTYNSYLIIDEKVAVMDTVDTSVSDAFFDNIEGLLGDRPVDYLVVNHMEPDHSAEIGKLCRRYPDMKIVGNAKTFQFLGQFFEDDLSHRHHEVSEGDTLSLGAHTLTFAFAPMVHWPEVMVSYESATGILFAADAFGTFGAFSGGIFADEVDFEADYLDEARRYYTNIVGKYGPQVQAALKKVGGLDVKMICPLHGPIWRENLGWFINKYDLWSRYEPEEEGVLLVYGSIYGHTKQAAEIIAAKLKEGGAKKIHMYDVSKTHSSYLIAEAFRFSHIVLMSPTYNMGLFLPMDAFMHDMAALNLQNRKVALVGNGTWAPQAHTLMQHHLDEMKEIELLGRPLIIRSALKPEQCAEVDRFVEAITETF